MSKKPTVAAIAASVDHLHDRITMIAGRFENRTVQGSLARFHDAVDKLRDTAGQVRQAAQEVWSVHHNSAGRLDAMKERLDDIERHVRKLTKRTTSRRPAVSKRKRARR